MFRLTKTDIEARHNHRKLRRVPRHLPPHLMRDIGLEPWPEERPDGPVIRHHRW